LNYRFFENGTFVQAKISTGGSVEDNTTSLPSGVLNCAKIITRYLMALDSNIVLIDEPELHLEPRMIRKLFHFLVWSNIKDKKTRTNEEEKIYNLVQNVVENNWDEQSSCSIWAVVESTNEKSTTYYDINLELPQKQLFIASHSPSLINELISLGKEGKIYEFDSAILDFNKIQPTGIATIDNPLGEILIPSKGLFTVVRNLDIQNISQILENLGCRGSDLLQTNGIIWVEGPSDVIYIKKWLDLHSNENNLPLLLQGKDYDFQMFGGTLLDSLCIIKENTKPEIEIEEYKKLISMFSFSRNAFVVIDSDSVLNADNRIVDKSKFSGAKSYIRNQIESLKKQNSNLGLWYKEGNIEIRTIESYLDDESIELESKNNWTKKIAAQKITESWDTKKKLSDFKNNLAEEIKILHDTIVRWNK
jgi:AAA domain, putative AbiEii toxin, Type IV TA system